MTDFQYTPPPELVQKWIDDNRDRRGQVPWIGGVAIAAAQWAADQELEACCEWLDRRLFERDEIRQLRAARRPKPPSLKQQALDLLKTDLEPGQEVASITLPAKSIDTIRRALEALPE